MATAVVIAIIALIAWGLYGSLFSRKYPRNKDKQ
jgi:hypothetical protein